MTLSVETLIIAGLVLTVFLVSVIRSSVKREGFFRSLYWTLKGITLIIYHVLMFVGAFLDGVLREFLSGAKGARTTGSRQRAIVSKKMSMSEKSLHNAVARHLERTCHVRTYINEPIPGLEGARRLRRPDVWAQSNHRWYVCEVKDSKRGWTADLDRAPFQLGTLRTAIRERYGDDVSCFVGITERLYDALSDGKLVQLHDEVRDRHMGVLVIEHDGRCRVESDFRRLAR